MEYFQQVQERTGQTVAVINDHVPSLTVAGLTATQLATQADALNPLAQTRDDALAAYDLSGNTEYMGYSVLRAMTLSLPHVIEGELDERVEAEVGLLDLLPPIYALVPRTTELALQRAQKLVSALTQTNTYLAAKAPPQGPITSAGKGVTDLSAALAAQPALQQTKENKLAAASTARTGLRSAAAVVDRLNKRFYSKLESEARENPALQAALGQIDTGPTGPQTLGIASVLQGGADQLHVLVSYDSGSFTPAATSTLEWMVVGVDADFTHHHVTADPSGNTLGPFTAGQTVKLRSRVVRDRTTTGSIRTLTIVGV